MRILIIDQYFWSENFRITDLPPALRDNDYDATVLTGMPHYPIAKVYTWWLKAREMMDAGIVITGGPLVAYREGKSWQLVLNYLLFSFSGSLFSTWVLRKQSFDVVFTPEASPVSVGVPEALMAKLKRVKHLLWSGLLSATGAIQSLRALSIVGKLARWIYKHCNFSMLVAVTPLNKAFIYTIIFSNNL